jgi:DedD protein
MPSREPELYKDKIEVSLDGRQIFYLFFGGAAIVGLVFVLGVLVGRRVEARGHLDRAETRTATDPLAALDRLDRSDDLSFHGALTGSEPPTEVEKSINEVDKHRAGSKPDKKPEAAAPVVAADAKPARPEARVEPISRPEADKPRADKHDSDKKPKKHDDASAERSEARRSESPPDKPVTRPDARDDGKPSARADGKPAEGKGRFTLQLSSFQDKAEAEAFLSATKSAGYQPYLTEADVGSKGTFYRIRLGSYRSLEAANDAKTEYEKAAKKTAQVMRL